MVGKRNEVLHTILLVLSEGKYCKKSDFEHIALDLNNNLFDKPVSYKEVKTLVKKFMVDMDKMAKAPKWLLKRISVALNENT